MKLLQSFFVAERKNNNYELHGFDTYNKAREFYVAQCEGNKDCLLLAKLEDCNQ